MSKNICADGKAERRGADSMKMIYAIVHGDDSEMVIEELNKQHFSVTKIASTGGFLKKGSTTLMIGTEDDRVKDAVDTIKRECSTRKKVVVNTPYIGHGLGSGYMGIPVNVEVGGATIFVMDVEEFYKI